MWSIQKQNIQKRECKYYVWQLYTERKKSYNQNGISVIRMDNVINHLNSLQFQTALFKI
jgi:hypothetical protein